MLDKAQSAMKLWALSHFVPMIFINIIIIALFKNYLEQLEQPFNRNLFSVCVNYFQIMYPYMGLFEFTVMQHPNLNRHCKH